MTAGKHGHYGHHGHHEAKHHRHHEHHGTPYPRAGVWMWALASLFYFYDYLLQISPGAMKPELFEAFALDAVHFGTLSAIFHYSYGVMQIPAGMLMDKFGPRRVLTLACALTTLGCFLFAIADVRWQANLSRFLMGFGAAFALMGCFKIASIWFPKHHFAFITGATITVGFLGAVLGLSTISHLVKWVPWRQSMQIGAVIGLIGTVVLYVVLRDKRTEKDTIIAHTPQPEELLTTRALWKGLKTVCTSKTAWFASIYSGLMFCPTQVFALWGVPYLVEAQGFDRLHAGRITSFLYIGWIFGAPFFGWLSDRMGKRLRPMYYASISTLIVIVALLYLTNLPQFMMSVFLFALGFCSSGFILAFVVVREANPLNLAGTALGFSNTLNTLIAAFAQPVVGLLLQWSAQGTAAISEHGEPIYQLNDYQNALSSLIALIALSILLLTRVPETGKGVGTAD